MAFGNQQSNNRTEISKNTRSIQFYNSDKTIGSALVTGFWNNFVTLKICPLLPEKDRTQTRMFNYETFINTALTAEKALTLFNALKLNILKLVEEGSYDFNSIGVPVGSGFVEVSNGEKINIDKNNIVITIYSNVDGDGKTEEFLHYVFKKVPYYINYDSGSGSIDSAKSEIEFLLFMNILKEHIAAATNAIAHSIRNLSKYEDKRHNTNMEAIMTKLGIQQQKSSGYGNNGGGNSSGFFRGGSSNNEDTGLQETEIEHNELAPTEERLPI